MKVMNCALALAAASLLSVAASAAHAQDGVGWTAEIGYTRAEFSESDPEIGFNTIHLRGGAQFSEHFGAELELAAGLGEDTVSVLGVDVDVKLNWHAGVYLVGSLPTGENGAVFARVGVVRAEIEASAAGFSAADDQDGYGLGIGYRHFPGGGPNGFRIDFTHYGFDGDDANALGVSYIRRF